MASMPRLSRVIESVYDSDYNNTIQKYIIATMALMQRVCVLSVPYNLYETNLMALETSIGVLLVPYDLSIVDRNSRNKMIIMALEVHHSHLISVFAKKKL